MFLIIFLFAGGVAFKGVCAFDALNFILSERFRDRWLEYGAPPGFLRSPLGAKWLSGALVRQQMVSRVFFSSPRWMLEDPDIRAKRREYLWCCGLLILSAVVAAALSFR